MPYMGNCKSGVRSPGTPLMRDSYRVIRRKLSSKVAFKGNTMSGTYVDGIYTIFSYSTVIAWIDEDGDVHIPSNKYSMTTSRHQNLCRTYL